MANKVNLSKENIKISIIIPVYNVEKYLSECLDSIINQTLKDIEIICINDGSTDNSLSILKDYASLDSRIIIVDKINEGVSKARNVGIDMASGEYIMFFDSDDYYCDSSAFEIVYDEVSKEDSDIGVFGYYNLLNGKLYVDCFYSKFKERKIALNESGYFDYPIFVHDKIIKTSFLKNFDIRFNEEIKNAEDFIFSLNCYFKNPKYTVINKCLYVYREDRPFSATNNSMCCVKNDFNAFIELYKMPEFKMQSEDFQLKIVNRFVNVAIWYIQKFNDDLHLINDSEQIIKFLQDVYPSNTLRKLKSYKKLKNYKKYLLFKKIFSVRNSSDKVNKILTILGLEFKIKKNIKKCKSSLPISQQFIKDIFINIKNNAENYVIEPINANHNTQTIVFSFDNNYCKYFGVVLQSLILNSSLEKFYDLIVFSDDISDRNKKILQNMLPTNFSIRFFSIEKVFNIIYPVANTKVGEYWNICTYYRLFIPILLRQYARVLYCDSDIVFSNSIDELFSVPFDNNYLMAVLDSISPIVKLDPLERNRLVQMKESLGLVNPERYINSGVCLFNIELMDLNQYLNDILEALSILGLLYPDQDVLNVVFQDKVKFLPWKYNFEWHIPIFHKIDSELFFGDVKKNYMEAYANPSIIHYTSSVKPWNSPEEEFADVFWKYARQTPFYEEIIFTNMKNSNIANKHIISNLVSRRKIFFNYYRCKLLSCITFGSTKNHYKSKRTKLKEKVKSIRQYLNVK